MMERLPDKPEQLTSDEVLLHFVLDGVTYSVRQNQVNKQKAIEDLKQWFPEVEFIDEQLSFDV